MKTDALTCQCTHEIEDHDVYASDHIRCGLCECRDFSPKPDHSAFELDGTLLDDPRFRRRVIQWDKRFGGHQ